MGILNNILNTGLNLIFPMKCLSCGMSGSMLCGDCLSESPTALRETTKWIFPFFDYRHSPIKKALWFFKYKGRKNLAKVFAECLHGKIMEELSELALLENFNHPLLIPIPLSKVRYRERGYNQAELLCRELVKLDKEKKLEFRKDILIKPRETEHQARIENRSERLKNIVGSFTVQNPESISRRNIILIDDITTTGATLNEARKVLKNAGARKIIAFTVAH